MDGRERAVILTVLLLAVLAYLGTMIVKFIIGSLEFAEYKGEMAWAILFLSGLLVKLPPTVNEAKATAEAAVGGTTAETVEVTGDEVNVTRNG